MNFPDEGLDVLAKNVKKAPLESSGHAWSLQNRPCRKAIRDQIVLLCCRLRKQVCFCAPASRTAFEYVSVVKQAVEHVQ